MKPPNYLREMIPIIINAKSPVPAEDVIGTLGLSYRQFRRLRQQIAGWDLLFAIHRNNLVDHKEKVIGLTRLMRTLVKKIPGDPESQQKFIDWIIRAGEKGWLRAGADPPYSGFEVEETAKIMSGDILLTPSKLPVVNPSQTSHRTLYLSDNTKKSNLKGGKKSKSGWLNIFRYKEGQAFPTSDEKKTFESPGGVGHSKEKKAQQPPEGVGLPEKKKNPTGSPVRGVRKVFKKKALQVPEGVGLPEKKKTFESPEGKAFPEKKKAQQPPEGVGLSEEKKNPSGNQDFSFPLQAAQQPYTASDNYSRQIKPSRSLPDDFIPVEKLGKNIRKTKAANESETFQARPLEEDPKAKPISTHGLDRAKRIQEADQNAHPKYHSLSADERTWEFAQLYKDIVNQAVVEGHFERNLFEGDTADHFAFFNQNPRFVHYQRARIRADLEHAEYGDYIQFTVDHYQKARGPFDPATHSKRKTFPAPWRLYGDKCVELYWGDQYRSIPPDSPPALHMRMDAKELYEKVQGYREITPDGDLNLHEIRYWRRVARLVQYLAEKADRPFHGFLDFWVAEGGIPVDFVNSVYCPNDRELADSPEDEDEQEQVNLAEAGQTLTEMGERAQAKRSKAASSKLERAMAKLKEAEEQDKDKIVNAVTDEDQGLTVGEIAKTINLPVKRVGLLAQNLVDEGKIEPVPDLEENLGREEYLKFLQDMLDEEQLAKMMAEQQPELLEPKSSKPADKKPTRYRRLSYRV